MGIEKVINEQEKEYASKYGFNDKIKYEEAIKGLSEDTVKRISKLKGEPDWMLQKRLDALRIFQGKPMPKWGPNLDEIAFEDIYYYLDPLKGKAEKWDDLPEDIRRTLEKLNVPKNEQKMFLGTEAQYDSKVVYNSINKQLEEKGVIFISTDEAVKKYPDLVKKYFGTVIPASDNKFAALNTAVWSGGSFVYVPKGVKLQMPLEAYFRINAEKAGQFERTLIIAEEGSEVTYMEGCTAPIYSSASLHSAVVEIIAHKNAKVTYITIQNWSKNVYNLVTQRAHAYEGAYVRWIDGNIGSKVNMKYPSVFLREKGAKGEIISVAVAGNNQVQDSGGKVYHLAPDTSSKIVSKSISSGNGTSVFRGLVHVAKAAMRSQSAVRCDALILDDNAKADTYPYMEILADDATTVHEATVGKIGEDQLFYLMSRGLSEEEATTLIVMGFLQEFTEALPAVYSLELRRLISLDMSKAVG